MKVVKTYANSDISGTPLILKLQSVLGVYAYIKVYPTIESATGGTSDTFTTNLEALVDANLSKECIVGFVVTGGVAYFTKAYRSIDSEVEAYAGTIANLQIHLDGYLSGTPRVAMVYINSTPYYYKVYPSMVSKAIADAQSKMEAQIQGAELLYISIIDGAIENNFPLMTASGELKPSSYNHSTYALSGHNHTGVYDPIGTGHTEATDHVSAHESTYNHSNYNTAYTDRMKWDGGSSGLVAATGRTSLGLGSAATQDSSAFASASHTHDARYYTESEVDTLLSGKSNTNHNHNNTYSLLSHNHDGQYDEFGAAYTEAVTRVSAHEGAYNHINYNTAYAHVSNISNPHLVTKSQIGLGNVENTALSTWTGSTSIITVGALDLRYEHNFSNDGETLINISPVSSVKYDGLSVSRMYIGGSYAVGTKVGCAVHGIAIGNMNIASGTPQYKQALTIDAQTGATNNWSIVAYGNSYFGGYVSADSFIDRTPDFAGDGVEALRRVKGKDGQIDHKTLPKFARKTIQPTTADFKGKLVDKNGNIIDPPKPQEGRGIGEMISILVKAVQQLTDRIEDLEKQIGGK